MIATFSSSTMVIPLQPSCFHRIYSLEMSATLYGVMMWRIIWFVVFSCPEQYQWRASSWKWDSFNLWHVQKVWKTQSTLFETSTLLSPIRTISELNSKYSPFKLLYLYTSLISTTLTCLAWWCAVRSCSLIFLCFQAPYISTYFGLLCSCISLAWNEKILERWSFFCFPKKA